MSAPAPAAGIPLVVVRLTRAQFTRAARTAPRLSPHRRGQVWAVTALMRPDGVLEAYIDELAARLESTTRTADRLLAALVEASLLQRACPASPAGPPIYLARSPLMIRDLSAGADVSHERTTLCSARTHDTLQDRSGAERTTEVSRVMGSDLRKREKPRARARVSTAGTAAGERRRFQLSTQGGGLRDAVQDSGLVGAFSSVVPLTLAGPLTRGGERAS